MTAYAQYNAEALFRDPFGEFQLKATQANNGGDVLELATGLLAVVQTLGGGNDAIAVGDPFVAKTIGVYDLLCNATSDTYADG